MKKLLVFVLLAPAPLLFARGVREEFQQADEKARISYAVGLIMGSNLRQAELEFDYPALAEGVKAAMGDAEARFSDQEAVEIVEAALENAMEKKAAENRLAEEEFLAKNGARPEVRTTASGLQYETLVETDGEKPEANSTVRVYYEGSFTDGRVFDKSGAEDGGALIPLDGVISGWTEGIMLMSPGSKYKFFIPSNMAYGKEGIRSMIPPYSTLIFTVELIEIVNSEPEES
ncbi:MAG: FKBP-type peptidyl-prolyl cis-trans isomerase [Treponema sp.]|nr:FKBP-type peptidyl-prolyl cis-trans isomerase [Treponema sp.]